MNEEEQIDEISEEIAALKAEAIKEDGQADIEAVDPENELLDAVQESVEDAVESSDSDTENTEKDTSDDADTKSANDNTEDSETTKEEEPEEEEDTEDETDEQESAPDADTSDETEDSDSKELSSKKSKRYEKDMQRLNRNRKEFEEEKAKYREEYDTLKKQVEELSAAKEEQEKDPSSKEYMDLAKWYEEQGEYDKAEKAKEHADLAREKEYAELETMKKTSVEEQEKLKNDWFENANKLIAQDEYKDLADATTEYGKKVKEILNEEPILYNIPDGFQKAAVIAKGQMAVESLADKEKQIAELQKENKRLSKLTSVGASGANEHPTQAVKQEKSIDQEINELRELARKEDAMAVI